MQLVIKVLGGGLQKYWEPQEQNRYLQQANILLGKRKHHWLFALILQQ